MKNTFKKFALIVTLVSGLESHALPLLHTCESVDDIKKRATDEICDYFVDASEDCFEKLNERFSLLTARPASTPPKEIVIEAEPIKESYEAAIKTVQTYMASMKQGPCGDQRERVKVMIKELDIDLRDIGSRITKAKAKLPK